MNIIPFMLGKGKKNILVMTQMFPVFPEKDFFIKIFEPLFTIATFHLYDPLANLEAASSWGKCKVFWQSQLEPTKYELIIGFSLGGCFLQQLMEYEDFQKANYVMFSTPVQVHSSLYNKLQYLLEQVESDHLEEALFLLEKWVQPLGNESLEFKPGKINLHHENMKIRLSKGIRLLLTHDARSKILSCQGQILEFVGALSQLVNSNDVAKTGKLHVIDHAGMRVLQDQNKICWHLIKNEYFSDDIN